VREAEGGASEIPRGDAMYEDACMARKPDRSSTSLRTAILVLGMHRSGTSALARLMNFMGAALPRHLLPANPSNPRGHWESAPLVELHDQLLSALDSSWDDWRTPGARWKESDAAGRFSGQLRLAIDEEYGNAPLFVLKDPRMCRTLPYWMSILEKSGIRSAPLLIVRNPLEVAESLRTRDDMPFEKAMLLWLRHNLDAEFETRHLQRNIVTFDALLEDWKLLAVQTAGRLGITWPRQPLDAAHDMREFLDLELHNHRATQAELEAHTEVPHWVKSAYRALTLLCDEPRGAEPKRELDRVRHAFAESAKIFGAVAFAQTDALKQARIDVSEANRRARTADLTRKDLETALSHLKAEAKDAGSAADTYQKRTEEAEKRVTALTKQVADLERGRNQLQETLKRASTDANELKTLAKHLSDRTDLIEGQLKTQQKKSEKTTAELTEARAKSLTLSGELQTAMQNAIALSKDLAAAKEQFHTQETRAIKAAAEARQHHEALLAARGRLKELEADDRAAQAEISELRAELAESWAMGGGTFTENEVREARPALRVAASSDGKATSDKPITEVVSRAKRIEADLRYERIHVEQMERRLTTWMGLASAALRKMTRLGPKPAAPRAKPARKRIGSTPATSGT
jgi:hypothetical protein